MHWDNKKHAAILTAFYTAYVADSGAPTRDKAMFLKLSRTWVL